jgi:DNA-binding transcriptional MerR regulator
MFTPGKAAELINCPPSTLRRYVNLFPNYLSRAARKRPRSYNQNDLSTIAKIKELLAQGVLVKDISSKLELVIDQEQPESTALTLPGLVQTIKDMQAAFDNQSSQIVQLQSRITWLELPFYKKIGRTPPVK